MNKFLYSILVLIFIVTPYISELHAQLSGLHGDDREYRMGLHSGNLFRTSFFNDGTYGGRTNQAPQVAGEWPINSGHYYLVDGNIFVGSELVDAQGTIFHILSENKSANIGQSRGDQDPNSGAWWTFLPLPGFANPEGDRIAMVKSGAEWPNSWPASWPDIGDPRNKRYSADAWRGSWNGYFGRDVFNADEESYFVADDYMNREFMNKFLPDDNNPDRGGLGIRMYVRGFQWAKAAVQDALFCLYDIENIGTHNHSKMAFSYKIGNNMGETNSGSDSGDDNAAFVRDENLAYMTDNDDIGAGNYSPVGNFGGAFLESPGLPFDGIDNDNDGQGGTGGNISAALWGTKTLNLDDQIVIINYDSPTFERTVTTLRAALAAQGKGSNDTLVISYSGRVDRNFNKFWGGKELSYDRQESEISDNLFDDNLNGVIDENRGNNDANNVYQYLYILNSVGYKYHDYFSGAGANNPLLDERRDDGVDNDNDWNRDFDDTGADGLLPGAIGYPGSDAGEGDGVPSPGEPHFDLTDVDETDQLGLTSCNLYEWTTVPQYDDEGYWGIMTPGIFSIPQEALNVELNFGSGYFPLKTGQTERISMAIICGTSYDDLISNKHNVALAYNQNYNFSKAPNTPTIVRAVAGDNRVTLVWDTFAEQSRDPITGEDFEGYKIYRSTEPSFNDNGRINDSHLGNQIASVPVAQFDLIDDILAYSPVPSPGGIQFWLGSDNGLRHYWVDTTAQNGYTYYYAVTSYDKGSIELGIDPSECTKYAALNPDGTFDHGKNVVIVKPEAPAAGYTTADLKDGRIAPGQTNTTSAVIDYTIVDPSQVKSNHTYKINFADSILATGLLATKYFTLKDVTTGEVIVDSSALFASDDEQLDLVNATGFKLLFSGNPATLSLDSASSGFARGGTFYGWTGLSIPSFQLTPFSLTVQGQRMPIKLIASDFDIIFGEIGTGTSTQFQRGTATLPSIPVNFNIIDKKTNQNVPFAFRERHVVAGEEGRFSISPRLRTSDEIIFLAPSPQNPSTLIASWQFSLVVPSAAVDTLLPQPGDVLTLNLAKPFLSTDSYEFITLEPGIDNAQAKADLDRIKVVPNPYIVTNSWEPNNPYVVNSHDRALHFTHLPSKCTIKIFNVRGQLINTLEHDAPISDGTEVWNMLSKDNLEISYGIYIYHVNAEGVGEKVGKFVVIK